MCDTIPYVDERNLHYYKGQMCGLLVWFTRPLSTDVPQGTNANASSSPFAMLALAGFDSKACPEDKVDVATSVFSGGSSACFNQCWEDLLVEVKPSCKSYITSVPDSVELVWITLYKQTNKQSII